MIYKPVKVRGREIVDGGLVSTTNLDLAVEAGAKLIVVVNPLVPYLNTFEKRIPIARGDRGSRGLKRLPKRPAGRSPSPFHKGRFPSRRCGVRRQRSFWTPALGGTRT